MFQRDYIMRMIEQLGIALARILKLKEAGKFDEAEIEISKTGKMFFGIDMNFIHNFSEEGIIELLKQSDSLDASKCIVLAELLKEEGEIYEIQKGLDKSYHSYLKSLRLYLEGLTLNAQYRTNEYSSKIAFLKNKLSTYELPVPIQYKLLQYFEMIGNYAQAENILFQLIDVGEEDILDKGVAFYSRLLAKTDDELNQGNLPREEVEEGLSTLKKILPV
jgi:tetratricopeptide (TPR) repeat protein